jgi:hypothetical protein
MHMHMLNTDKGYFAGIVMDAKISKLCLFETPEVLHTLCRSYSFALFECYTSRNSIHVLYPVNILHAIV